MEARSAGAGGGLRTMRRKAVEATKLVETSFLPGRDESMPIVITPAVDAMLEAAQLEYEASLAPGELSP